MRRMWLGVAMAVAAGLLIGCGEQPEDHGMTPKKRGEKKGITVGFSQIGAESAWRTAETKSVQDEAAKRGIDLRFSDAQQKQENQLRAINSFIDQKVDAIILAPVVKSGWDVVLGRAREAKIPVVLVDRGVEVADEGLYATLIASDFVEEGRMAGEWLAKKTGGKCKIVQLEGTPGSDPANDRKKGFEEVVAKHKEGMEIIASQTADFRRSEGKRVMANIINAKGKDIQAVYAHNDDMALGAIPALDDAGMRPGKDVIVLSIDAVKDAFRAMEKGQLNATVECNPLLGPMAFDAVEKLLKGEKLPKRITVKDRLFEQQNAAEDIKTRQY